MKNAVSIAIALILWIPLTLQGADTEFSYDASRVKAELAALEKADAYLTLHDASEAELRAQGVLSDGVVLKMWNPEEDGAPFGIPSFIWGFCFGLLGVLFVYLMTDNNKEEAKKAFIGCVVSGALWTVWWVVVNIVL